MLISTMSVLALIRSASWQLAGATKKAAAAIVWDSGAQIFVHAKKIT